MSHAVVGSAQDHHPRQRYPVIAWQPSFSLNLHCLPVAWPTVACSEVRDHRVVDARARELPRESVAPSGNREAAAVRSVSLVDIQLFP